MLDPQVLHPSPMEFPVQTPCEEDIQVHAVHAENSSQVQLLKARHRSNGKSGEMMGTWGIFHGGLTINHCLTNGYL